MSEALSERRMVENEVVFRTYNERIQKGFDELTRIATEDNQSNYIDDFDLPLQFYCECSDEDCRKRVKLLPSRYNQIHENRDRFVIVCGHDIKEIEKVVGEDPEFCIVEKINPTPESAFVLNKTDADNS